MRYTNTPVHLCTRGTLLSIWNSWQLCLRFCIPGKWGLSFGWRPDRVDDDLCCLSFLVCLAEKSSPQPHIKIFEPQVCNMAAVAVVFREPPRCSLYISVLSLAIEVTEPIILTVPIWSVFTTTHHENNSACALWCSMTPLNTRLCPASDNETWITKRSRWPVSQQHWRGPWHC